MRTDWLAEFDSALADRRHVTFTMHPEVIGRGHRAALLERLIGAMRERGEVWFATHGEVERWLVG
jgi:peptidoglycan/xylan/chitin deacetylase (PgdA/CDA1 family)